MLVYGLTNSLGKEMNERIRELASQCWDERLDGMHFDQELFAELIVQECAAACFEDDGPRWAPYYSNKIKEHFGVE